MVEMHELPMDVAKELARDAYRYRFLRAAKAGDNITVECFKHSGGLCHLAGDELDTAVDKAMSANDPQHDGGRK